VVFGSQSYHLLPELVAKAEKEKGGVVELDFPPMPKFDYLPQENAVNSSSAMLAVQEGCDKFCTFCVVPYTRGAEYSRKVSDVLAEARRLVDGGAVEIMLLGQNVNAYHGEGADGKAWSLAQLIRELAKIDGLRRIRYTTSHPRDMSDDLIAAHAEEEKLMPYLHLPVQSGSDAVLKRMNRKHTAADYISIIERMRRERQDMAFSGDFIVGFPGETEQDFEDTLALARHVGYASAYSFKYSPRPGTPAATEEKQVPEEVKDERIQRLQALLMSQSRAFNAASVGQVTQVLLDREGKYENQLIGRSPYMQSVHVREAERFRGNIIPVRITGASANSLTGEAIGG
jgi:tRNA-2-methylthio-N6-dimethylallyladenosine synthase